MYLFFLAACASRRGPVVEVDAVAGPLDVADRLWAHRDDPASFAAAAAAYEAVYVVAPGDARVLARLSRLAWARAQAEPTNALGFFEAGRAYGTDCLLLGADVAAAATASGYRIDAEMLADVGVESLGCLTWTAANELGLVERRGEGGALALGEARALAARAYALGAGQPGGSVDWVEGASILMNEAWGGDRALGDPTAVEAGRAALWRAIELGPNNLWYRVDLARWSPADAAGVLPAEVLRSGVDFPENVAARARGLTLLEAP